MASLIHPLNGYCQSGILDPAFGIAGKTFTSFSGIDQPFAMALQNDNKVILVGTSTDPVTRNTSFAVSRYNTNGAIDTTFGTGGKVLTAIGILNYGSAVALQSDGKIIVAGESAVEGSNETFALARYNINGSLDASFGKGGIQLTSIGAYSEANSVVIQSDGKIVLAGESSINNYTTYFALARYNINGILDLTFGTNGLLTTLIQNQNVANALVLQSDGKIIASGISKDSLNNKSFAVVRYNTNGSLDSSFGIGGKQFNALGTDDEANAMTLQTDGKIILCGTKITNYHGSFEVMRYNTNGNLDASFGTGGIETSTIGTNDYANAVTLQNDGKIVVAGVTNATTNNKSFALTRYNTNGSLDSTFGNASKSFYPLTPAISASANATKWLGNRIYMAGLTTVGTNYTFALAAVISNNIVLPVTWLEVNASIKNKNSIINFTTTNESNALAFSVERSIDGEQYLKMGNIAASNTPGNHQYAYSDSSLQLVESPKGLIYYRIKEIEKDGQLNYSVVVTLPSISTKNTVSFYPNPVNKLAILTIHLLHSQKVEGFITDISGKRIYKQSWNLLKGINTIQIDVNNFFTGIYYLHLKADSFLKNIQFIKK